MFPSPRRPVKIVTFLLDDGDLIRFHLPKQEIQSSNHAHCDEVRLTYSSVAPEFTNEYNLIFFTINNQPSALLAWCQLGGFRRMPLFKFSS